MRRGVLLPLTAIALAALGGCGGEGEGTSVAADRPMSCPDRATETLADLDEALQAADAEALEEAWRPNHFKWFSLTRAKPGGGRRHFVAHSPARAVRYVVRNGGLPIELAGLDPSGGGGGRFDGPGWVGVGIYEGRWKGRRLQGKAEVACDEPWVKVLSLGVN